MTEKELRHLGRRGLIEIIAEQKRKEAELLKRLELAEQKLSERTIAISNAGSIAEAALSVSGIFQAAQDAADAYLESLRSANSQMEQVQEQCRRMLAEAQQEAQALVQAAEEQCIAKQMAADAQIQAKWEKFRKHLQQVQESQSQ